MITIAGLLPRLSTHISAETQVPEQKRSGVSIMSPLSNSASTRGVSKVYNEAPEMVLGDHFGHYGSPTLLARLPGFYCSRCTVWRERSKT